MSDEFSVLMVDPFEEFEALGWNVRYTDGHSFNGLSAAFVLAQETLDQPVLIIADTIKGRGTFYEDDPAGGHGSLTISQEELDAALLGLQ